MSSTVQVDGYDVTSTHETADAMVEALTPEKPEGSGPRVLRDQGKAVPQQDPDEAKVSEAASELGKRGGQAAAEARKKAAKAKPAAEPEQPEAEAKPEENEQEAEREQAEPRKGNPRHDPTARVAQATREAAEARREAAELKRRLAELEARVSRPADPTPAQPAQPQRQAAPAPDEDQEPKEDDFENYADYVKAAGAHAARREFRQLQERQQREARAAEFQASVRGYVTKFSERLAAAGQGETPEERHAEFMSRLSPEVQNLRPSLSLEHPSMAGPLNVLADQIVASEHSAGLLVFLSENPDALQRFATLRSPHDVVREVAKIEYRLEAATAGASAKPAVSQAKPPFRPVNGTPSTADAAPGDDASFDEHVAYHNARERRAKR
ncbi:hypothetical protein [Longimicrobium sp.]|uniref:hypothetical protein n=1 Tax=Longimicrobium sp. TaxID=2029185 RepID=UPI002E32A7CA|nr:hypothetical protein [Longimicrobium sp.]HEX6038909.1 hypothetical protein [Longimicrobium sp.]